MNRLMSWLSAPGFLGTGAPRFSDIVVLAILLVLAGFGLGLRAARRGEYRAHALWMGTTYLALATVVGLLVIWTRLAPRPFPPLLMASAQRMSLYGGLMPIHVGMSVLGLALGFVAMALGRMALLFRSGRSADSRWGQPHRTMGALAFGLLLLSSIMGLLIYALRYLGVGSPSGPGLNF